MKQVKIKSLNFAFGLIELIDLETKKLLVCSTDDKVHTWLYGKKCDGTLMDLQGVKLEAEITDYASANATYKVMHLKEYTGEKPVKVVDSKPPLSWWGRLINKFK